MSVSAPAQPAPMPAAGMRPPRPVPIRLLILAAMLLTFAPVCRHAFVAWDDDYTIEHNWRILNASLVNALYYVRHPYMDLYVPVTYAVWSGVARLSRLISGTAEGSPLDPRLFHTASVVVHAINALLVFGLLRRLVHRPWPAAAGALLFALHPFQVEPVAWTSGLKDLLCAMFALIALNQYIRAAAACEPDELNCMPSRPWLHHVLGLAAMLLGMLCKPTAMVTPLLAAVIDRLILRRSWRAVFIAVLPYLALTIPCIIWTKLCQPAGYLRDTSLWMRPLVAADALAFYLYKLVLPFNMAFDYGRTPWVTIDNGWAYFTWVLPASIATGLFVYRKRVRPLIAGALLMAAGVAPVLGLTVFDFQMISTVADHYMYLAMLGPALAAAWMLNEVSVRQRFRHDWLAAVVVLGLLAARTADQERNWSDSQTFFAHALKVTPRSWSSYYALAFLAHEEGRELVIQADHESAQGQDDRDDRLISNILLNKSLALYERALHLNRSNIAAHHGAAVLEFYLGRYQEAAEEFTEVLHRRNSVPPEGRLRYYLDSDLLGQCLHNLGRYAEAVKVFSDALRLDPPPPGAVEHLKAAQTALAAATNAKPSGPAITDTSHETTDNK